MISTSSLFRIEGSHDKEEPVISSEKGLINEYGEVVILDAPTIANQALYVVWKYMYCSLGKHDGNPGLEWSTLLKKEQYYGCP